MSFASSVRRFFEELFGSRLVEQLTADLLYARSDAERMRIEYQGIIADVRAEKALLIAKLAAYDFKAGLRAPNETPRKPSFGVDFMTSTLPKTRWDVIRDEHDVRMQKELEEEAAAKVEAKPAS